MTTHQQLNIKGMVCRRCIDSISDTIVALGIPISNISLGKVLFEKPVSKEEREKIKGQISRFGFEILSDKHEQLLVYIKAAISEWIENNAHGNRNGKLSDFLVERFCRSYDTLGEFFNRTEGKSIEKYFINQRLLKVKELLVYTDLPLTDIAFKTGFSSAYHLSNQFKNATGQNPSALRQNRKVIDQTPTENL